jgi:hypothetical protein
VESSTIKGVQVVNGGNNGNTEFKFGSEVTIMLSDIDIIDFGITNIELICQKTLPV